MNKIQSSLEDIVADITAFYDYKKHHFMTLNAVQLAYGIIEVQWIFSDYIDGSITMFYIECSDNETLPSIAALIPNATISQEEVVDMFGLKIENTPRGLYLDPDSKQAPLKLYTKDSV